MYVLCILVGVFCMINAYCMVHIILWIHCFYKYDYVVIYPTYIYTVLGGWCRQDWRKDCFARCCSCCVDFCIFYIFCIIICCLTLCPEADRHTKIRSFLSEKNIGTFSIPYQKISFHNILIKDFAGKLNLTYLCHNRIVSSKRNEKIDFVMIKSLHFSNYEYWYAIAIIINHK